MNYSHVALDLRQKTGCTLSECAEAIQFFEGRMTLAYKFLEEWNSGVLHKKADGTKYTKKEFMESMKQNAEKRKEYMDFDKRTYTDCGELDVYEIRPATIEEMDTELDGGDGMVMEMFDINGISEGDFFGDNQEWEVLKTFGHHESGSYWFYIKSRKTKEIQVVWLQ
jgi:hypothetical protein